MAWIASPACLPNEVNGIGCVILGPEFPNVWSFFPWGYQMMWLTAWPGSRVKMYGLLVSNSESG